MRLGAKMRKDFWSIILRTSVRILRKRYGIGSGGVALPRVTSLEQDIPLLYSTTSKQR